MENITKAYETIFVINPTIGDDAVKALIEKFTTLISDNGTIDKVSEWGKRKFAYPIQDLTEGFYVMVEFTAPTSFVSELERIFNIAEGVLRSLTVAKGE